jgi:hypothetical protein
MIEELLSRVGRTLTESGIPHMVIGGQAVAVRGQPRFTDDIDFTLGIGAADVGRVLEVLRGSTLSAAVPDPEAFVRQTHLLPCKDETSAIVVDFAFTDSAYELHAIGRATPVMIAGYPVRFASPEDLVIHKIIASRPHDLKDVAGVLIKSDRFDAAYVRKWLVQFEEVVERPLVVEFDRIWQRSRRE